MQFYLVVFCVNVFYRGLPWVKDAYGGLPRINEAYGTIDENQIQAKDGDG